MKTGKLILLILIICSSICSSFSYALTTIYSEDFSYSNTFASHGWVYSNGACGAASEHAYPIPSIFSSNAFGMNETSGCGFAYTRFIKKTLSSNITSGNFEIELSVYLGNDSTVSTSSPLQIILLNKTSSSSGTVTFAYKNSTFNVTSSGLSGFTPCSKNIYETSSLPVPYSHAKDVITIDYTNKRYSWIMDGYIICQDIKLDDISSNLNLEAVQFNNQVDSGERLIIQLDNIKFSTSESINSSLYLDGEPCTSGEQCASGKCEYGACVLKQKGEQCTSDSQCASGDCLYSLCTKPTLSQNLNRAKKENFGDDEASSNIISLIIMIGLPIMIISATKNGMGALLGVMTFILLGFLFTFIGWLSPFILLGIVVCVLIAIMFIIMIESRE